MTRAIAYARFSTDRQSKASIVDQLRLCRQYAAQHGWELASEHCDQGISGAALGNRPGAHAALAELGAGDVLLVNDLSRLSRSQDLAPLLSRLRHRGARVIGVQDGFDSESRTARMQAGLSGIMSEEFRQAVADRTRSALELRAREGRPAGGKAYGDVVIVREVFERFAAGENMREICSDLNARGVPSPGAGWKRRPGSAAVRGRWMVSALYALLHNERYAGRLVWNRRRWVKDPDTGRRVARERPQSEWIVREIEPVVDEATWASVRARLAGARRGRGGVRRYLLSGLLECELCGGKMIVVGGRGRLYRCSSFHGGGVHACRNNITVKRAIAEERILEPVIEQLLSPAGVKAGLEAMRAARARAERTPGAAGREVRELERLVREGVLSADVAAPSLAEARRRASTPSDLPWPSEALWRETVAEMREVLEGEDVTAARACLQRVLGPIRCRPVPGGLLAELRARQVMLKTGTGGSAGIWVGSGGVIPIHLPSGTRAASGAS